MLIAFNKPYGVLSQFTDPSGRATLAAHVKQAGVYPIGRLDLDSEGLLLLTDQADLVQRIGDPRHATAKTYLVQVEGTPTVAALNRLRNGVHLNDGPTLPAHAELLSRRPGWLWSRDPPIRERKHIPTHWLQLSITEGRNRQVRRMTAAVGLPTLRLVRCAIGPWTLDGLAPGEWREVRSP